MAAGAEFPPPPKGSPGGVRAAARSIGRAGDSFAAVGQGLTAASGALEADWKGWAAGSYHACARGIANAIESGARTFESCEEAISSYADSLERAQEEIERLRALWEEAKTRQAAAGILLAGLTGQLVLAKPSEVAGIEGRMSAAAAEEDAAGDEAAMYVRRAHEAIDEFEREASRHEAALSGEGMLPGADAFGSPFSGGVGSGLTGPGFGVPAGGLGYLGGTITVQHPTHRAAKGPGEWIFGGFGDQYKTEETSWESTNVPGFENYWRAREGHSPDALQDDNSLINPVFLFSGGVSGVAGRGLVTAAGRIAQGLSLTGRSQAVSAAARQAELEAAAVLAPTTRHRAEAIRAAGINAASKKQFEIDAAQGRAIKAIADLADKAGVPLPPGFSDIAATLVETQGAARYAAAAKLLRLQMTLEAQGTPAAMRAAEMIGELYTKVGR